MQLRPAFVFLAVIAAAQAARAADERASDTPPRAAYAASPIPAFLRNHDRAVITSTPGATHTLPVNLDPSLFAFTAPDRPTVTLRPTGALRTGTSPAAGALPATATLPAAGLVLPGQRGQASGAASPEDDDDEDDDGASASRPGSFKHEAPKIPSPFLKTKTVAPHVNPDVSYDVNERTSVGMFGEMNRVSRGDTRASLTKPERDLGAGFTLQYKFGRP